MSVQSTANLHVGIWRELKATMMLRGPQFFVAIRSWTTNKWIRRMGCWWSSLALVLRTIRRVVIHCQDHSRLGRQRRYNHR